MTNEGKTTKRMRWGRLWWVLAVLHCLTSGSEVVAANFVVRMQGTRFVPRDITISVGDSITWTNLDFTGHDSVSGTNGVASGFWRTPLFGFGGAATVVFTNIAPRSYGYYCTPHAFVGMVGSVTVLPANTPPTVSILEPAEGAVIPAGVPLLISADPLDADGRVVRVDFAVDGTALSSDSVPPFSATYDPTPGNHALRAVAVDDRGATSAPVVVNITALLPPAILQQPQNTNALEFAPVSFSVIATGAPPLALQWQFNGTDIPGATNATYFIASVGTNDVGSYSVVVSNQVGAVTSAGASLLVTTNRLPSVALLSPTNGQFVASGADVALLAEASDSDGVVRHVEFHDGTNLVAVVTNPPFAAVFSNITAGAHRIFARAVDDRDGAASSAEAQIEALLPPTISITAPLGGESFPVGTTIQIGYATTGNIPPLGVEFLTNGVLAGNSGSISLTATGRYVLEAIATDIVGQRGTSAPVSIRVFLPEAVPPSITITSSPANFARLTDARITLAGTARDGAGVLQIEAENVTSGGAQLASGAERWRAELELVAGPNTVRVRSVDQAFNVSPWVTRFFTRVVTLPLTVRTNGQGSVSPNLNGRLLEIGKTYRLTAKPARGQNFDRWEGATYQGATLEFVMQSNLVLTANFVPNPFTNSSGPYSGLVVETNTHAPAGNGLVTVQVAESGAFSGRLRVAGRNYSFRGFFDLDGFGHGTVLRPAQTPIVLAMQLDLTGQTGTITGSATDGSWVADLLCYRNPYAAGANPSPYAGTRIFLWRADGTDALVAGTELKVNARGQAALKATFTDGRRASASSSVSQEGRIPVAFSSDRLDSLVGWASVGLSGDPRVVGDGILIPAGTNGSPTTLTIQPLAP